METLEEPCPKCGRRHSRGEYLPRPDKKMAPHDVQCPCGLNLRWTVPIFKTTESGYVLRPLRDDESLFVESSHESN